MCSQNQQLPHDSPAAGEIRGLILEGLSRNALFLSAALPKAIFPPLFNRYAASQGHHFGNHVDNAIRYLPDGGGRIRTDLSATLFLSDPESYDGGDLVIEDTYGAHSVKLAAGDLILYPASSLHRVEAVTRGERLASFFWIESMVRDDGKRSLLLDMDVAVRELAGRAGLFVGGRVAPAGRGRGGAAVRGRGGAPGLPVRRCQGGARARRSAGGRGGA